MNLVQSRNILLLSICLTSWPLILPSAICSASPWESVGPYGGDVRAIAVDPVSPATIYIGTSLGGVFKSTDAGATWHAVNSGLPIARRDVLAIAIDPLTPNRVYVGLDYGGIFKTTDGGTAWSAANGNLSTYVEQRPVRALTIDPAAPGTIYAGTDTGGILRTADGGASWLQSFVSGPVGAVAIDPFSPNTVYAGVIGSGGLFQSFDRGVTWGQTSLSGFILIRAIAVSKSIPGKIYVGFDTGRIAASANGGATWNDLHLDSSFKGRAPDVVSLVIDSESPPTLYAGTSGGGLFRGTDAGSWSPAGSELTDSNVNTIASGPSGVVYAGTTGQGFFRSIDGGVSWRRSNAGLTAEFVDAIAVDPRDSSVAYAALGDLGVYKTRGGTSWQSVGTGLSAASVTTVTSLGVSSVSELYAGTNQGLFRSADGGASWLGSGFGLEQIWTLALDRGQPETIYVSSAYDLFRGNDSGATWTATHVGGVLALAVARSLPNTVYATVWPTVCPGACPPGRVVKTSDGGRAWTTLESLTNVTTLLVDPTTPATVYAGPRPGGGVFKSMDGGTSWTAAGADSLPFAVSALAADSNSVLFAGTTEGGVFESFDGGRHWIGISDGLADLRIWTLAVAGSSRGPTLYAGTYGSGIFRLAGLSTVSRPRNPSRVVQPRR